VEFVGLEHATPSMLQTTKYIWTPSNGAAPTEREFSNQKEILGNTLRLRFKSRVNLTSFQVGGDYVFVSLCPYREEPLLGSSAAYADGVEISHLRNSRGQLLWQEWDQGQYAGEARYDGPSGIKASNGFYYYEGFFENENQWTFASVGHTSWTPPKGPHSLCFKVFGPSIPGGYETNEVQIPAEVLTSVSTATH
jgi:hypothetical protein